MGLVKKQYYILCLPSSEEYSPLWAYSRLLYTDPGAGEYHREPDYRLDNGWLRQYRQESADLSAEGAIYVPGKPELDRDTRNSDLFLAYPRYFL